MKKLVTFCAWCVYPGTFYAIVTMFAIVLIDITIQLVSKNF